MTTSSAPAKVFLFGEHAVVYGEPAIAAAVDLRVRASVEDRSGGVRVASGDLDAPAAELGDDSHPDEMAYLVEAARLVGAENVSLEVESEVPVGSGLGSSAAVTVAAVHALKRHVGEEVSPEEAASLAHEVEDRVQGAASPTDTWVSARGGVNFVSEEGFAPVNAPDLGFVAGDTGETGSTAELVEMVGDLRKRHSSVRSVISTIGEVTVEGREALESGDLVEGGRLMDVNHGLLEALGVSTPRLSALVHACRESGALGAKITGAGGGGCMVALRSGDAGGGIEDAVEAAGGSPLPLELDYEGVRAE